MNTLLTTIGFHTGDAVLAERLCDWIFELNQHKSVGHCLLVADSEVHPEMQTKVRLAGEVAFETCELIVAPALERIQKAERLNNLFLCAAGAVAQRYRLPWLWLDPDSVPLTPNWLQQISDAYYAQPKRYMGSHLKATTADNREVFLLGRSAVYPLSAIMDVTPYCGTNQEFNMVAGRVLVDRSTKSKLFQQLAFNHETDPSKVRPDAAVLHSDKHGIVMQRLRANLQQPAEIVAPVAGNGEPKKRSPGRPRKIQEVEPVLT